MTSTWGTEEGPRSRRCVRRAAWSVDASSNDVWTLIRPLDLSVLSPWVVASELLGPSPPSAVGTTRRLKIRSGAQETAGGLPTTWEVKLLELSDAKNKVVWETLNVHPQSTRFSWRRDSLRVRSLDGPIDDAPMPERGAGSVPVYSSGQCCVEWKCEFGSRASVSDPPKRQGDIGAQASDAGQEEAKEGRVEVAEAASKAGHSPPALQEPPFDLGMCDGIRHAAGAGQRSSIRLFKDLGSAAAAAPSSSPPSPSTPCTPSGTSRTAAPSAAPSNDLSAFHHLFGHQGAPADSAAAWSVSRLVPETNAFALTPACSLRPGDVCEFRSGDVFPADCILLWSTSPRETAVNEEHITGANTLRLRQVVPIDPPAPKAPPAGTGDSAQASSEPDIPPALVEVQCPACTMANLSLSEECVVCGTPLAGAGAGAGAGVGGQGGEGHPNYAKDPWGGIGKGPDALEALAIIRDMGHFEFPPARAGYCGGKVDIRFVYGSPASSSPTTAASFSSEAPPKPRTPVKLDHQQVLKAGGSLVFTERVVAMVMHVGPATTLSLSGGCLAGLIRKRRRPIEEASKKAWKTIESTLKNLPPWVAPPIDPEEYERATGICWENRFHDVPEDGNCLMHAVWLGLKTLLEFYPELKLGEHEPPAVSSAEAFREQALDLMAKDELYRKSVENQLRLWLELDASLLTSQVEDFYVLPSDFCSSFLSIHQSVKLGGFSSVNFSDLVDSYVELMKLPQTESGQVTYVPLGQTELEALRRVYQIRLQTVKSEVLKRPESAASSGQGGSSSGPSAGSGSGSGSGSAASAGPRVPAVDPRTIRPEYVGDQLPPDPMPLAHRRIVRLVNKDTNHYLVHLPAKGKSLTHEPAALASAAPAASFGDGLVATKETSSVPAARLDSSEAHPEASGVAVPPPPVSLAAPAPPPPPEASAKL